MRKILCAGIGLGAFLAGAALFVMRDAPPPVRSAAPAPLQAARSLFFSGHSLTAPLETPLLAIARSGARDLVIGEQTIDGSTIRQRLATGSQAVPPVGTDILVVTEQHRLLDALVHADTEGALRDLQARFHAANPSGATAFFVPWANISDAADPRDWIAYERRAIPVWACVVSKASDAAEDPTAAIRLVPASLALAELVQAIGRDREAFPGFESATVIDTGDALFIDQVHVTELGGYFLASLTYALLLGDVDQRDAVPPTGVDPSRARTVSAFAADFARRWQDAGVLVDPCASASPLGFVPAYTAYMQKAYGDPEAGIVASQFARTRHALGLYRSLLLGH